MFSRCKKSCRCRGFTLIELLVASGIVSVITVMISVIVCNVSKVVSLQKEFKAVEGNIVLNDICVWINNLDEIVLSKRTNAKNLNNHMCFEIDNNAKSSLGFLSYDNANLAEIFFEKGKVGLSWDHVAGENVVLNKYLILSDNAKAAYLRPIYTEKYFEDKKNAGLLKGLLSKDITSWNNDQKMTLCYDSVKKLQDLKKEGKIAGVHLVVENNKPQATQSSSKKKFWFF